MKPINPLTKWWENVARNQKSEQMEAECESFLSFLSVELSLCGHFDQAFRSTLNHTQGSMRDELEKEWIAYAEKGQPLEKGLSLLGSRWKRKGISRTIGMLIHLSTNGVSETGIAGVKQLTQDMRTQHGIALKAYGNKLAVFSLVFIAVSALIPAFMLGFITVGSRFLELDITSLQVFLLAGVIFPAMDALVLGWGWIQTPAWMKRKQSTEKNAFNYSFLRERVDFICAKNGFANGFQRIIFSSTIEGGAAFLIVWSIYLHVQPDSIFWIVFLVVAAIGPFIINIVWQHSVFTNQTHLMERQLPDALLGLAATPSSKGFVSTLESVILSLDPPLKNEWKKMVQRMKRGMPVESAIQKWGEGRQSPVFTHVRRMLIQSYRTGFSLIQPGVQLAYELFESQSLRDERNATLLIEKYTILAAGGVLVPFLLGILTGVMNNLPFSSVMETDPGIFVAVQQAVPIYLFIYSILAACFVAFQEGNHSKAGMYMLILIPLAQIAFLLGKVWVEA